MSDTSLLGEVCIFLKLVHRKDSRALHPESELSFNSATFSLRSVSCDMLGVASALKYFQEKDSELVKIKANSSFHHYKWTEKNKRKVTVFSQPNHTNCYFSVHVHH